MNTRRTQLFAVPLAVMAGAFASFWYMLRGMSTGSFNPRGVPTALMGRSVPDFTLPGLNGAGFSSADMAAAGRPFLVNFFASWCAPCIEENPLLLRLQAEGVPIWGIAYKDRTQAALDYLKRHGNPYARLAEDAPGRVAIDWGLTGVPETYLIDGRGIVRWRMAGPLTAEMITTDILPLLRRHAT